MYLSFLSFFLFISKISDSLEWEKHYKKDTFSFQQDWFKNEKFQYVKFNDEKELDIIWHEYVYNHNHLFGYDKHVDFGFGRYLVWNNKIICVED